MNLQTYNDSGVMVIKLLDREVTESELLAKTIQTAMDNNTSNFLIDLSEVTHISSVVLGSFVTTFRNIESKNGQLKFMHVQPCVAKVFEMTRLNRIFEFFNDRDTALKSFIVSV